MIDNRYFEDMSRFRNAWVNCVSIMTDIDNKNYLEEIYDKHFKIGKTTIYNSVNGQTTTRNTVDLLQDIFKKYVIVENGCLFLKHEIFTAPAVGSFDILKKLRAYYKGNMKKAKGAGKSMDVGFYSLMQQNTKEALNTYYGIMINILSKYYNYDVAGSVTIRGRSTVSMNGITIEYIFGKYRPYNVSIHLHFINEVINKDIDWSYWETWFEGIKEPSMDELLDKLLMDHNDGTYYGISILRKKLNKLDRMQKIMVYYTGSFKNAMELPKIKELILKIMETQNNEYDLAEKLMNGEKVLKDNGKEYQVKDVLYLDPMHGPEKLKPYFDELDRYFKEIMYGYYWYEGDINEYGERLDSTEFIFKTILRDRIIITDTDSLIIYLDADMQLLKAIPGFKEVTNRFNKEMLDYVAVSFIINAISTIVQEGLVRYTKMANINPKFGKEINYKQEYFFTTLQTTKGAKNYLGLIGIQEGVLLPTKEVDLKGLSLKKSNFNPTISAKAKELVLEMIVKKENPDLRKILKQIDQDREDLLKMYRSEDNIKMFTISKFKKGYDNLHDYEKGGDRFKAIEVYNALYPEKEKITIPGSFLIASIDFKDRDEELMDEWRDQWEKLTTYNLYRLVTKCKCAFRAQIRSLYDINKKDDITEENCESQELFRLMIEIDEIEQYQHLKEYLDSIKKYYRTLKRNNKDYDKNIFSIVDKVKLEQPRLEDITKIALPLDSETVDDFITEFLATKDTVVYENLISVITEGLGLVTIRNSSGRATLSNVISYF